MIDIHTNMQISYCDIDMPFTALMAIMKDDFIGDNDFIEFTFSNGSRVALVKKHIVGFSEVGQETETY